MRPTTPVPFSSVENSCLSHFLSLSLSLSLPLSFYETVPTSLSISPSFLPFFLSPSPFSFSCRFSLFSCFTKLVSFRQFLHLPVLCCSGILRTSRSAQSYPDRRNAVTKLIRRCYSAMAFHDFAVGVQTTVKGTRVRERRYRSPKENATEAHREENSRGERVSGFEIATGLTRKQAL